MSVVCSSSAATAPASASSKKRVRALSVGLSLTKAQRPGRSGLCDRPALDAVGAACCRASRHVRLLLQANASPARMARTSSAAAARSVRHAHRGAASVRERISSSPSQAIGKRSGVGPDKTRGTLRLASAQTPTTVHALLEIMFVRFSIVVISARTGAGMRRRPAVLLLTRALRSTSATRRQPATAVSSVRLHQQPAQTSASKASPPNWFSRSHRTRPSLSPSSTMWIRSPPTPTSRPSARRDTRGGYATRARPAGLGTARPTAQAATGRRGPMTYASLP